MRRALIPSVFNATNASTGLIIILMFSVACGSFDSSLFAFGSQQDENSEVELQSTLISIQKTINEAEIGSIVYIPSGIYFERITVNKTVTLIGEEASTTIIDGNNGGTVVSITASNVSITGFTIQNSGWGWTRNGIYVHRADNCKIENNLLLNNCHNIRLNYSRNSIVLGNIIRKNNGLMGYGIRLINAVNCTAGYNNVSGCIGGVHLQNATRCIVEENTFHENDQGIRLYSPCSENLITANNVKNNNYDGMIEVMPGNITLQGNIFVHNNFINNTLGFIYKTSGNIWDDGYPSGGNYWSRHAGLDFFSGVFQNETGSDGIGDSSYAVNGFDIDRYPLMAPWYHPPVEVVETGERFYSIQNAINANNTLEGYTINVSPRTYYENVVVNKSLVLKGESRFSTIVDSQNIGKVLSVLSNDVKISDFTIRNSGRLAPTYGDDCGLILDHTSRCNITSCFMVKNRIGLYLLFSSESIVENNIVLSNIENGILLWHSRNNVLRSNRMLLNRFNFGVFGGSFSHFNNFIETNNTADGKPILYLKNVKNVIISNQTSQGAVYIVNGINVTVANLTIFGNSHGVFCYNVTRSRFANINASNNSYGIYLQDSYNNTLENNTCLRNWVGLCLQDSQFNVVEGNSGGDCEKGISLYAASYNSISGNKLSGNDYGIRLSDSHSNMIFHNNFIDNKEQASTFFSYQNAWDNGFEGNFWSDYIGNDTDHNGLGDSARIVNYDGQDDFPLLGIFKNYLITQQGNVHKVSLISNSTLLSFEYNQSANSISLTLEGEDSTTGFCRMSIPHTLIEPEIQVLIDGGQAEILNQNFNLLDDGESRWIYFSYNHSIREVVIIPELWTHFVPAAILLLILSILLRKKSVANYATSIR